MFALIVRSFFRFRRMSGFVYISGLFREIRKIDLQNLDFFSFMAIMVLTTEEKKFIFEHYFRSYGVEHQNGPSLRHVKEQYQERFNNKAPNNTTMLAVVETFRHFYSASKLNMADEMFLDLFKTDRVLKLVDNKYELNSSNSSGKFAVNRETTFKNRFLDIRVYPQDPCRQRIGSAVIRDALAFGMNFVAMDINLRKKM
ncbi:hypothetical protein ANN_05146 [Periplaneta americana]|uniref:DUF4817 domain-containing protein n=1 Tax=Periplaneta americana TaxID=6978 RepID=A0ABQ8TAB4_PERAM|nr:hypothetical protein ANN_05146 [Periplaneta americana]